MSSAIKEFRKCIGVCMYLARWWRNDQFGSHQVSHHFQLTSFDDFLTFSERK